MKLSGWSMGLMGMAAGAALALAGGPREAAAQVVSVRATGQLQPGASVSDTGVWYFKSGDEEVRVETRDGKVVRAERNGVEVPAARVKIEGGRIRIEDERGGTVFEMAAPMRRDLPLRGGTRLWRLPGRERVLGQDLLGHMAEPAEPPKVMLGVTLAEPEYSLLRHCGLDQRSGTLVNEVYKGMPAASAGIEAYDVITEIDGRSPATPDVVRSVLRTKSPGEQVNVTVLHRCAPKKVTVTLEAYDAERLERARQEQMKAAGIEPPVADILLGQWGDDDLAERLGSVMARVPNLDNQTIQLMAPGADPAEVARQIEESVRRLTEGLSRADALSRGGEDRARRVEERLERLERMLERLMDGKGPESPRPAAPPVPEPAPPKGSA